MILALDCNSCFSVRLRRAHLSCGGGGMASQQVARVPGSPACEEGGRQGLEKIPGSPFWPSSSLELGLSFCSRNFGAGLWSASRMPSRSKSVATPLGIPISGGGPRARPAGAGMLRARSPARLSVPLTLRDQKEPRLQRHKVSVSNCTSNSMHAIQ